MKFSKRNDFELKVGLFRPDIWKKFFMMRVVKNQSTFTRDDAPSLETLNVKLDELLATCSGRR